MFTSKSKFTGRAAQCNGASGGLIVHRVCASNHAHNLLQHQAITYSELQQRRRRRRKRKKNTHAAAILNFWMFDYYYDYYCCPGVRSRPGCICIGHKNNEKITRRHSVWHGAHVYRQFVIIEFAFRFFIFLFLVARCSQPPCDSYELWSQRKFFVNSSIMFVQWRLLFLCFRSVCLGERNTIEQLERANRVDLITINLLCVIAFVVMETFV